MLLASHQPSAWQLLALIPCLQDFVGLAQVRQHVGQRGGCVSRWLKGAQADNRLPAVILSAPLQLHRHMHSLAFKPSTAVVGAPFPCRLLSVYKPGPAERTLLITSMALLPAALPVPCACLHGVAVWLNIILKPASRVGVIQRLPCMQQPVLGRQYMALGCTDTWKPASSAAVIIDCCRWLYLSLHVAWPVLTLLTPALPHVREVYVEGAVLPLNKQEELALLR